MRNLHLPLLGHLPRQRVQVRMQANILLRLPQQNRILLTALRSENAIHILERRILRLGNIEPHPHHTASKENGKEDVSSPLPGLQHRRRVKSDGKVVEPVGRSTDRSTLSTDGKREDLSDDGPGDGTPGGTEGGNVDPDKGDADPTLGGVARPVVLELGDDDTGGDHGDHHDGGTDEEEGLAAEFINREDTGDGGDEEDDSGDTGSEKGDGSGGETEGLEDVGSVIDN